MNGCGFVDNITNPNTHYQNVRGLRTKLEEFYLGLSSCSTDLIAITETGFNESINDAEIVPSQYKILRSDRNDGRKQRGSCLMATPRFELRRAPIPGDVNIDDHAFELVGAAVYLCNKFLFLMCVVYIPPNTIESEYMILFKIIEKYCDNFREVIVVGDFNLYSGSVSVCNYYDFFQNYCGFDQSNRISNQNGRCLDLVLSTFADGEEVVVREAPAPLVPGTRTIRRWR